MGAKWPFQQFCWDTGQVAFPSSHGVRAFSWHQHQLPPCASPSQPAPESRTQTQIPFSALPSTARPRGGGGRGLAALYSKTLCSFRKTPPQGSSGSAEGPRAFQGREGLLLNPSIPHHSRGGARKKAPRTCHPGRGGCTRRRGCSGTECWGR